MCRGVLRRFAAQWPVEQFLKYGIVVEPSPLTRSELFLECLPMVNSGRCELLENPRLFSQLVHLERRTGPSGKDSVTHRPGSHDDLANAAAGAMVMSTQPIGQKVRLPVEFTCCVNEHASAARTCVLISEGRRCHLTGTAFVTVRR